MVATDKELGHRINTRLLDRGIETPMQRTVMYEPYNAIVSSQEIIMQTLGLDLTDDSLVDTPKRVAKMYVEELFYGLDYDNFPNATAFENKGHLDEMILTRCSVMSTCEHHFLPFIGNAYVAYIPDSKLLGLSKFNRVVDFFARRPQVQERLTAQCVAALQYILGTDDVAIVVRCEHFCGKVRGVQEHNGMMVTSQLGGKFRTVPELRAEFMAATRIQ